MQAWFEQMGIAEYVSAELIARVVLAIVILVAGLVVARLAAAGAARFLRSRATAQGVMVVRRAVYYALLFIVVASTLHQLGFRLGVLLGAAGILTVAVGFASQTSVSNLISGLFVIAERSFVVGDIIKVDDILGEVLSIDLLSVKLRTFDNLLVRVPNENIIKTKVTNLTRFPIRRIDLQIGVAYKEDMRKVRDILFHVAEVNTLCLDEPAPLFIFKKYGESALEFQFSIWTRRENYLALLNSIQIEIKEAFDENGIEIPFPHRSIYAGSVTDPIPVKVVDDR
jgi:small-conductance mechanosensitive channel